MNCPYCSNEMKQGYIQCRDNLIWAEKKRAVAAIALTSGETVNLAENSGGPFSGFSTTAFYCGNCQKVIIDIPRN